MTRALKTAVAVPDPETNLPVWFQAGEVPPGWAAELITNPSAWSETEPEPAAAAVTAPDAPAAPPVADAQAKQPAMPPRSGKGSGLVAWAEYARNLGVEVEDDANRDDVIAALELAGHPTE